MQSPNTGLGLEMEIKRLYVLHRFHQRGLGRRLMNEILATARQDGIAELFLKVQKVNQSAVAFYSRYGFCVAGEESSGWEREIIRPLLCDSPYLRLSQAR